MIDNKPSKLIRSIVRDMSEFLIRQVMHEDIWYFSYKIRNGQFLSQAMKEKRKDHTAKLLNKLKYSFEPNMLWFFPVEKNFCQDQIVNSQYNYWLTLFPQNVLILMKTKQPVHIMEFGVPATDGDVMPSYIFPCGSRLKTEAYIKCLEEVVLSWIERVCYLKTLHLAIELCTMPYKQENPLLAVRKFLWSYHPLHLAA